MAHHILPPTRPRAPRVRSPRAARASAAALLARLHAAVATLPAAETPRQLRAALAAAVTTLLPGTTARVAAVAPSRGRPAGHRLLPRGRGKAPFALELDGAAALAAPQRLALELLLDAAAAVHARLRAAAGAALLREEAERDFLTGIFNRRLALRLLEREIRAARRRHRPLALVLVDLDNFKSFNDHHGHQAGDEVLRQLARLFAATARTTDIVGRFGGEEFLIALPDTSLEDAALFAERLRQAVESYGKRELARYGDHPPTISIGVCPIAPDDTLEAAIERADRALYESKSRGRNCFSLGLRKGGST